MTFVCLLALLSVTAGSQAAKAPAEPMPMRGFCIAAPHPEDLDKFIMFIERELAPRHVNTLVLRVEYDYQFESHPELRDGDPLTKADVKKLVAVCRKDGIKIIPLVDFLGHQSYHASVGELLKQYPEFDETPWIKLPQDYVKNPTEVYCKSYCTLHPKVHEVIFAVMDELCDVFEADTFHAGMDEVFFLGEDKCPRCAGHDKAELFADEVRRIHDHLQEHKRHLWIWGDRLLDGKMTGLGKWEGSCKDTARAIDLIPKDILICDWHYNQPVPTAAYFAVKGFNVVTCPYKNGPSAAQQAYDMTKWRATALAPMKDRFQGVVQTVWCSANAFLEKDYAGKGEPANAWNCFVTLSDEIKKLETPPPAPVVKP
jgi:hypothetical protein